MKLGLLLARLLIGGLMIGHGTQKLFGWFGGPGVGATGETFAGLGLRPGKAHAIASGAAEAGGGALLASGLLTPLGQAALTGSMTTAIWKIHGRQGPWVTSGGWEYNGVLIATAFAIVDAGPGHWSLDAALLGRARWGTGWAIAALAAGAAGAAATVTVGKSVPEPKAEEETTDEAPSADAAPPA
jgi:putative oxidoreductase